MTLIHPKYDVKVHQRIKVMRLVLDKLGVDQEFLYDEMQNRWLTPIKVLKEETFKRAKGLGVAFVKIHSSVNDKDWYFDSRFVMDHGSPEEKDAMHNLLQLLNEKKQNGRLINVA